MCVGKSWCSVYGAVWGVTVQCGGPLRVVQKRIVFVVQNPFKVLQQWSVGFPRELCFCRLDNHA